MYFLGQIFSFSAFLTKIFFKSNWIEVCVCGRCFICICVGRVDINSLNTAYYIFILQLFFVI